MKALIVSHYYHPEIGAAASRITFMAEGLRQEGADVDVLTCLPNYPKGRIFEGYRGCFSKRENINGVNVFMCWSFASVSKSALVRMLCMLSFSITLWFFAFKRKLIKSYDVVIIQSPPILVGFSALLLFKKLYRRKVILNVSDLWPTSAIELGAMREHSLSHRFLLWVERYLYKHVDAIQGQSNEILRHVKEFVPTKPLFLYRNLQHASDVQLSNTKQRRPLKIVYAGLLGVAQDILGLVKAINFKELGAEFQIYGAGNQAQQIETYTLMNDTGAYYNGMLSKSDVKKILPQYHVSIVPLLVRIQGAVPSKIFDLISLGIPVLFCGGGEGADIVEEYHLGLTSQPGNIEQLKQHIREFAQMDDDTYMKYRENCMKASDEVFSFDKQMQAYHQFVCRICKEG